LTRRESTAPEVEALDISALVDHLHGIIPVDRDSLEIELLHGGRSNLTYRLSTPTGSWVVRRPPLGVVAQSANDVQREFTVLQALERSAVPVPRAVHLCQDAAVIGAPFLVMSFVEGTTIRSPEDGAALGGLAADCTQLLIDQLARLHVIDPGDVGLTDFGKPKGYLERQVSRWWHQWGIVRTRELEVIGDLHDRLARSIPTADRTALVHGDFRIDNVLFDHEFTRVTAVLDWEMATLGNPLADLAMLLVYWDPTCAPLLAEGHAISGNPAFPSVHDLVGMYAERTGEDPGDLSFFLGLAYFKAAVIAEGIHRRYVDGDTIGRHFERVGHAVAPLACAGLKQLVD
jgi:aminoglycoside phosphotransferase (APT) family kinase protein